MSDPEDDMPRNLVAASACDQHLRRPASEKTKALAFTFWATTIWAT